MFLNFDICKDPALASNTSQNKSYYITGNCCMISEVTKNISTTQVPVIDEITVVAGFDQFDQRFEFNSENVNEFMPVLDTSLSDKLLIESTTIGDLNDDSTNSEVYNSTKVEMLTSIHSISTPEQPNLFYTTLGKNITVHIDDNVSY